MVENEVKLLVEEAKGKRELAEMTNGSLVELVGRNIRHQMQSVQLDSTGHLYQDHERKYRSQGQKSIRVINKDGTLERMRRIHQE